MNTLGYPGGHGDKRSFDHKFDRSINKNAYSKYLSACQLLHMNIRN